MSGAPQPSASVLPFTLDDLLVYTEWERDRWHTWFPEQPSALAVDLGAHNEGRIHNVGELVRHIFSAEKRYVERSLKLPLTDTSAVPADDVEPLFAFGRDARSELRGLLATFAHWDAPREMPFGTHTRIITPRKMILQSLTHEIRHWAQVATFLRQAGYKPGSRDLLGSPLFGLPG